MIKMALIKKVRRFVIAVWFVKFYLKDGASSTIAAYLVGVGGGVRTTSTSAGTCSISSSSIWSCSKVKQGRYQKMHQQHETSYSSFGMTYKSCPTTTNRKQQRQSFSFNNRNNLNNNEHDCLGNLQMLFSTREENDPLEDKKNSKNTDIDSSLFFLTTKNDDPNIENNSPDSTVQRKYETFRWKYNPGSTIETMMEQHYHSSSNTKSKNSHDENSATDLLGTDEYYYNINYRAEGPMDGIPILFVHGFGANVNHFRYQFPVFTKYNYRVYAVDLIGFGASDKPTHKPCNPNEPFGYCIELFVQLILDFITYIDNNNRQLQQEPNNNNNNDNNKHWNIAGNSIGGLCCLCVAAIRPNIIQSVTLFNCAGGMTGFRYEELPWYLVPILQFVQTIVLGPLFGPYFFNNFKTRENVESILINQGVYRNPANVNDELLEILLRPADDVGAEKVFLQVFGGPPGPTPESVLPNVCCPILALWGGADPWTPVDYGLHPGNTFGQYSDKYALEVIPGAGHCPHDEVPTIIHAKMIPWLVQIQASYVPPPIRSSTMTIQQQPKSLPKNIESFRQLQLKQQEQTTTTTTATTTTTTKQDQ